MNSTQKRKIVTQEELQARLVTPVYFYGNFTEWKEIPVRDSYGPLIRNGVRYSIITVRAGDIKCQFEDVETLKKSLRKTYDRWVSEHPNSRYRDFDDCIRLCEPECPRLNPDAHGVRLVMIPQ